MEKKQATVAHELINVGKWRRIQSHDAEWLPVMKKKLMCIKLMIFEIRNEIGLCEMVEINVQIDEAPFT